MIPAVAFTQPKGAKLICDETYMANTKTQVRVITYNDVIYRKLVARFAGKWKRVTVSPKMDRLGSYEEIAIYFPMEIEADVLAYLKTL